MKRSPLKRTYATAKKKQKIEVTLVSSDGKKFKSNKQFLSKNSPVFKTMFENKEDEYKLQHTSADIELLLKLMSSLSPTINYKNLIKVIKMAHQYDIDELKKTCEAELCKYVADCDTPNKLESIVSLYKFGTKYQLKTLVSLIPTALITRKHIFGDELREKYDLIDPDLMKRITLLLL